MHDGCVWHVWGSHAWREIGIDGNMDMHSSVLLAELPPEVQAKAADLTRRNRCECPLCDGIRMTELGIDSSLTAMPGFRIDAVQSWPSSSAWRWRACTPTVALCVLDVTYEPRVYVTSDGGERFRRVALPGVESGNVVGAFATDEDGALALWVVVTVDGRETLWFRSRDEGRRWDRVVEGVPQSSIDGSCTHALLGRTVAAWNNAARGASLHVSRDGARTFETSAAPLDAERIARVVFAPNDAAVVYAIVHATADGAGEIAVSRDGGATWERTTAPPMDPTELLVGRDAKTVIAFGGGTIARSADGGATWTVTFAEPGAARAVLAHPDGRLFYSHEYDLLLVSGDDGTTWTKVIDQDANSLAPDLAHEGDVFLFEFHRQFRLTTVP